MTTGVEPDHNCPLCQRLVDFREQWRDREPGWHNAPVASFGDRNGRLLIVGLAPGVRGANRTGRPFTGDYAGDLLYQTLISFGFARGTYQADPADGLQLVDSLITNAVRCVPPENKPLPAEIRQCRPFLEATIAGMERLSVILALGRVAHDSVLSAVEARRAAFPFAHGAAHPVRPGLTVFDSYHCSRYNTNTGRLTTAMFEAVFTAIHRQLNGAAPASAAS